MNAIATTHARRPEHRPRRSNLLPDADDDSPGRPVRACLAEEKASDDDAIPKLETQLEGYRKLESMDAGRKTMYTLYVRDDSHDVLAELPAGYEKQLFMLGCTLSGGLPTAGIQGHAEFLRWKRHGRKLLLIAPQLEVRTTGDLESERSLERLFTDKVRIDVPIVAETDDGRPVIDLDDLFVDRSKIFFGFYPGGLDLKLVTSHTVKAFAENISLSFQMPWRARGSMIDGQLVTIAYALSVLPEDPTYTPREADPRVGYFIAAFDDLGRVGDTEKRTRRIKRWKLEKADPSLALSPPREPIVFYIDHKTPIRYRRWVRGRDPGVEPRLPRGRTGQRHRGPAAGRPHRRPHG